MAFTDFVVRYNPEKDSPEDLTKKIMYSLFVRRLLFKKPVVIGMFGDSGEGKSRSSIRLQEILMDIQGQDIKKFFDVMNICTPIQYAEKMDKLLYDKEYKKCNVLTIHEARTVVKAKLWQNFLNQAVADVNAMSRTVKPLCFIIASQFVKDITRDVRYTLTHYLKVHRPMGGNRRARVQIYIVWKDDRDLETPKLRKRKLQGYIIDAQGRYKRYIPKYLELKAPNKEVDDLFEEMDKQAKTDIIKNKLHKVIKDIELDMTEGSTKIDALVNWYFEHKEELNILGKRVRGKWRTNHDFRVKHDLNNQEIKTFEDKLSMRLNYAPPDETEEDDNSDLLLNEEEDDIND